MDSSEALIRPIERLLRDNDMEAASLLFDRTAWDAVGTADPFQVERLQAAAGLLGKEPPERSS